MVREPVGPEDTPEKLEEERIAAQEFIDTGTSIFCVFNLFCVMLTWITAEPLDDDDMELKEQYILQGFPDWSRRDFQQLIRGMETYGW